MPIDWTGFGELVHKHQRFLLTTHVRPDADGLGSMLALAGGLRWLGKDSRLVLASTFPSRYRFMDPEGQLRQFDPPWDEYRSAQAAIILDTGTWNQLGAFGTFLQDFPGPRAVIDHHMTQDDLGAKRYVDTAAEATGRLVHEALGHLQVPVSPAIAAHLFCALAMDTGWFRHGNTRPESLELAAVLVRAGADPTALYEELFERNSEGRLRLLGRVLERLGTACGGKVAWLELYQSDYEATGSKPQDSEDLVNYPRSLDGVEVGLFFMEQPRGGVKVSFRSKGQVDVARLAERWGGGGHRQASGAILTTTLAEARSRVLEALAAELQSCG